MSKWIEKWVVYGSPEPDRKNISYIVARDVDNNFGCSCAAWKFQKGHKSDCKHIGQKKEEITTEKLSELNREMMQYYSYGLICFLKELHGLKLKLPITKVHLSFVHPLGVPTVPENMLTINAEVFTDKAALRMDIDNIIGGGRGISQIIVDNLINRLSFYRMAAVQLNSFNFQKEGVALDIKFPLKEPEKHFRINKFLRLIEGAYLATTCLGSLTDMLKKDRRLKLAHLRLEPITPKLFGEGNPITDVSDFLKPNNISRITEAFHSLLLKNHGNEYATLLMEDKLLSQLEPPIRSF